jgi:hypothetical protein
VTNVMCVLRADSLVVDHECQQLTCIPRFGIAFKPTNHRDKRLARSASVRVSVICRILSRTFCPKLTIYLGLSRASEIQPPRFARIVIMVLFIAMTYEYWWTARCMCFGGPWSGRERARCNGSCTTRNKTYPKLF